MSAEPTIGGVPLDEIEAELVRVVEDLYERGSISSVDSALRLTEMARRAGTTRLPPPMEKASPSDPVSRPEQIAVVRACLAAGVDLAQMRTDLAQGVTLRDGRVLRVSSRALDGLLARLAEAVRIDDGRRALADAMRLAEVERLARVAARTERTEPAISVKASQALLDRLDEWSPPRPAPLADRAADFLGSEQADLRELEAFYAEHGEHGEETEGDGDPDGSDG